MCGAGEVEGAFGQAVETSVAKHLSNYGFAVAREIDWVPVAEARFCRLRFIFDRRSLDIIVQPLSSLPTVEYEGVYLFGVLRALDPEGKFEARWVRANARTPGVFASEIEEE